MSQEHKPITFNSPLEAGIRAVSILGAAYPQTYDLQRLVAFDYLLVHTGDIGGPDNLHPPTPMRSAELLVRRKLVEQSLLLMMTRDLVEREVTSEGIKYGAGENAATFLSSVSSVVVKFFWTRRSDGRVMHRRATGRQGWPAFRTVRVIGSQVLNAIGYCYKS